MAFNLLAVADQLAAVVGTALGTGPVQFGAPLAIGPKVSGYLTLGDQPTILKTNTSVQRDCHFFLDISYRIDDDVAQVTVAERALMTFVDTFHKAIFADLSLNRTCMATRLETGLAETPEYRVRAAREFREYPIVVSCTQQDTYNPTP